MSNRMAQQNSPSAPMMIMLNVLMVLVFELLKMQQ